MGRLDDAAKRKVVELRRAGLSFRKIKAVLELENIKVSAQAIYLFLKEFQGKSRPEESGGGSGGGSGAAQVSGDGGDGAARQVGWPNQQVWNMMRDARCSGGYAPLLDAVQQGGTPQSATTGRPPGGADSSGGGGSSEQQDGRKEEGIRIVSVTSLARGAQHGGPQMAVAGGGMRRKVPMSPASSSIMVARKRLLDKALLHKARMREMAAQSGQQVGPLYGRGQACFQGNDARKVTVVPPTPNLGLTSARLPQARRGLEGQPVASLPRRTLQQRAGLPARSVHPPLQRDPPSCTAIRPANPAATPAGQGTSATSRAQHPPNPSPRKDPSPNPNPNPGPPQASQEVGWRSGLQEQLQTLGTELRGLGLAVRLLTEQQSRLEREQAQQTQVQRQILSTLQALASSLQQAKTPPPPGPAPYSQDSHGPTRTTYAQCSQPPCAKYCELDGPGLESLEAYKLSGLSPPRMNGFQACGAADGLPLGSAQAHTTSSYTPPYTESTAQAFAHSYSPAYTQSHAPAYSQTHAQSYTEAHGQAADYPVTSTGDPLQGCSPSANLPPVNPDSPLPLSPHDPQLNIIKVEAL